MTAQSNARTRIKVNLFLDQACKVFRELFQSKWEEKFGSEWNKESSYRILGHDLKNIEPSHTKLIEEGDVDKWDLTTLRAVLTAEDLLNLPSSQKSRIVEVDNIQREIAHPTSSLDAVLFNEWCTKLQSVLVFFGVSDDVLERIKKSEQTNSDSSPCSTNSTDGGDVPKFSPKLDDTNRVDRILTHRRFMNQCHVTLTSMFFSPTCVQASFTLKVPLTQELPRNFAGFKPITIIEMNPFYDRVYKGRTLTVTVIDEPAFTGSSIALVVEDEKGDAERCCIYGSPHMKNEAKAREVFGPGCKMIIINPYMRMAMDGKPVVRVDDPASAVMRGYVPNMCRYCCRANATKACGNCKSAWYCNRTCQKLDWKKLSHKLICHKYYPTPVGVPFNLDDFKAK